MRMWSSFIVRGDPNVNVLSSVAESWPQYKVQNCGDKCENMMHIAFSETDERSSRVIKDYRGCQVVQNMSFAKKEEKCFDNFDLSCLGLAWLGLSCLVLSCLVSVRLLQTDFPLDVAKTVQSKVTHSKSVRSKRFLKMTLISSNAPFQLTIWLMMIVVSRPESPRIPLQFILL
jgi:hypothetical protein